MSEQSLGDKETELDDKVEERLLSSEPDSTVPEAGLAARAAAVLASRGPAAVAMEGSAVVSRLPPSGTGRGME